MGTLVDFTITKESLLFAVQMSVRLALLVAGTSMPTLTTAPPQLAFERRNRC